MSLVGHGAIALVSIGTATVTLNPAAGWAVEVALESTCGPMIEAASIKGAIGGGILGTTASGPV